MSLSTERAALIVSIRSGNSAPGVGSSGTVTRLTSLMCAETEYIPYVGGQVRSLDFPGVQKQRSSVSIHSSEPTPTKRFAGVNAGKGESERLRRLQKSCFRESWCLG